MPQGTSDRLSVQPAACRLCTVVCAAISFFLNSTQCMLSDALQLLSLASSPLFALFPKELRNQVLHLPYFEGSRSTVLLHFRH